jgi:hypothetical protein
MRRIRIATGAAVLGGVVIMGAGVRWYTATRNPDIHIPAVTLPNPNAFDLYLKAGEKLAQNDDVSLAIDSPKNRKRTFTLAEKEALIAQNAEALSLVQEGLKLPYVEPRKLDPNALFPYYAKFRATSRLIRLEGDMLGERGDYPGSMNAYLDGIQYGQQTSRGGALISRLVSIACQAIDRRPVWNAMEKWDAATLKAGAKRMETITSSHVPFSENLTTEKYFGQNAMSVYFNDTDEMAKMLRYLDHANGSDAEDSSQVAITSLERLRVQGMYMIWPKKRVFDTYTSYMDSMIAKAGMPYAQGKTLPVTPKDPINGLLMPVFEQARIKDVESSETQNGLLTLTLAIRAYQAEHNGASPATLAELCPVYLSRIPDDPFALAVSTPFQYHRTEKGYVLYSIGPDGVDNHGEPIEDTTRDKDNINRYVVNENSKGDVLAGINIY